MGIKLLAAVCSDKGCVRQNNEDNFCLNGHYLKREQMDGGGLFKCRVSTPATFAVCDGMGGEEAGEEASLLSVSRIAEYMAENKSLYDVEEIKRFLRSGCMEVAEQAKKKGNHSGSTVAILSAAPQGMRAINMGDSRIYRLSKGELQQLSMDHTEMHRLIEQGRLTPEQAKTHPKRHMIYQYWGMPLDRAPFTPHVSDTIPYKHKDRFLLCSDGLTDMLSDEEIAHVLAKAARVEQIAEELVRQAKQKGGHDNVTVCVVEVLDESKAELIIKHANLQTLYVRRKRMAKMLLAICLLDCYLVFVWLDMLLH